MLPHSDLFMSIERHDAPSTQKLMNQLYPSHQKPFGRTVPTIATLEVIKQIVPEQEQNVVHESFSFEEMLEKRIESFEKRRDEELLEYRDRFTTRMQPNDHLLYVLHGWKKSGRPLPAANTSRNSSGGYFIRWNGKGIAINPGKNFLENLHQQGLHILDIDVVIVTKENPEACSDVQKIHSLNSQLNKNRSEIHLIRYYLVQKAFQSLSHVLKPNHKQERDMLRSLEIFVDSPEVEKIDITDDIILHYFVASSGALGIQLELKQNGTAPIRLGYVSGAPWSFSIAKNFQNVDLMLAAFGNTCSADYRKKKLLDNCLGFFGTYSMIKEIKPKIMLCSEFNGCNGDIRLEAIKLLREQCQERSILVADQGMKINLQKFKVQCSLTKAWVDFSEINAVRLNDDFGELKYLATSIWV